ncbi:hypothetical protein [Streptomyces sp. NPDC005438]|uniref:LppU/SCO3897 family protein n=1 Tax=Streptomyces sp. NPDC005438 TaxID=3156880 RepID=UPI0033A13966
MPPGPGMMPPPPPPQRSNKGKVIAIVVGLVVLLGIGGLVAYLNQDDADRASVGDCMKRGKGSTATDAELDKVDCGSSDAEFEVMKRIDGKGTCDQYIPYMKVKGSTSRRIEDVDPSDVDYTLCLKLLKVPGGGDNPIPTPSFSVPTPSFSVPSPDFTP